MARQSLERLVRRGGSDGALDYARAGAL